MLKATLILGFIPDTTDENAAGLLELLLRAHQGAAQNNQNASSVVAKIATEGSGSFVQGVASAILTLGSERGFHGPTLAARRLLRGETAVESILQGQGRVPGFGNSFFRDRIDPAFEETWATLRAHYPVIANRINQLREQLWTKGKTVYPNAALFTAAVCEILRVPDGVESAFFIIARLPVWAKGVQP
jgi:citrate synthase